MSAYIVELVARASDGGNGSSNGAPPQTGVIEGGNPTHYDEKNPITLFIIQVGSCPLLGHLVVSLHRNDLAN